MEPKVAGGVGTMESLEPRCFYRRPEDMSPDGQLSIVIEDDGDVILTVCASNEGPRPLRPPASIQFCTGQGGGRSPLVRAALLDLARAIAEENRTNPHPRGKDFG